MTDKMELTKHHDAEYGPVYRPEKPDPENCAKAVWGSNSHAFHQCREKRHPDTLDGAFCKQHCPERRKAKQESRDAKRRAEGAAAQAEREKAARMDELRREAAAILVGIGASDAMYLPRPHCFAVDRWLRSWEGRAMTHVTDAQELLVKARNRLGNAVLNPRSNDEAGTIGKAIAAVRDAIELLNLISQPGTSPQQTGDGANLSPAGDNDE